MHPGFVQLVSAVAHHGDDLAAYKQYGNVAVDQQGDLLLFNYTARAQIEGTWNEFEQVCRGVVINYKTGELVIQPMRKFFNLGERPETKLDALPAGGFEITEKLDGSLIMVARYQDELLVITRGCFTSSQAAWARDYLKRYHPKLTSALQPGLTLCFEAIYPKNRIVVNYGDNEQLILLAAIHRSFDVGYEPLCELARILQLPVVQSASFDSLQAMVDEAGKATGVEGWVVHYPVVPGASYPFNLRVKIKTAEYIRLHRIVSQLSPKAVRDAMLLGGLDTLLAGCPDEFLPEIRAMEREIGQRLKCKYDEMMERYGLICQAIGLTGPADKEQRKAFAGLASKAGPDAGYLFLLLDNRNITPAILKDMDLSGIANTLPGRGEVSE